MKPSDYNKNRDDDYFVIFGGAKITKLEANRIGVGLLSGAIGVLVVIILPIKDKGFASYAILCFFVVVGYFVIAPKIFKKSKKT